MSRAAPSLGLRAQQSAVTVEKWHETQRRKWHKPKEMNYVRYAPRTVLMHDCNILPTCCWTRKDNIDRAAKLQSSPSSPSSPSRNPNPDKVHLSRQAGLVLADCAGSHLLFGLHTGYTPSPCVSAGGGTLKVDPGLC